MRGRVQAKRSPQKAICAVAASILTGIYHMLKDGIVHTDLGALFFDARPTRTKMNRQLKTLGFEATCRRSQKPPNVGQQSQQKQCGTRLFLFSESDVCGFQQRDAILRLTGAGSKNHAESL
jgi:hypothetical protein